MPPAPLDPISLRSVLTLILTSSAQLGLAGASLAFTLWRAKLSALVLVYANWMVWDSRPFQVNVEPRKVPSWLAWLPRFLGEYFGQTIVNTATIYPLQGPYIFCMHPHGVNAFGPQAVAPQISEVVAPGVNIRHAGIRGVFYIPVFRELAIAFNTIPVVEDLMINHLKQGVSLTIVVGGAAEALLCGYPDVLPIVLDNRKGFVRLAVKTGARLVPCINYGESQTFTQVFSQPLRDVQGRLMDWFGYSIPLLKPNHWFAPLFPKRKRLTMVVGKPLHAVELDEKDKEFENTVNRLHSEYVEALKELHAETKEKYGLPSEQKLVIVSSQEARNLELLRSKI